MGRCATVEMTVGWAVALRLEAATQP